MLRLSKGREGNNPNEKMKGCISAAQMFANKLLPGPKKADQSRLWSSLRKASALLLHSQNTFSTNNARVRTDRTCNKFMAVTLCTVIWSPIRCRRTTEVQGDFQEPTAAPISKEIKTDTHWQHWLVYLLARLSCKKKIWVSNNPCSNQCKHQESEISAANY